MSSAWAFYNHRYEKYLSRVISCVIDVIMYLIIIDGNTEIVVILDRIRGLTRDQIRLSKNITI